MNGPATYIKLTPWIGRDISRREDRGLCGPVRRNHLDRHEVALAGEEGQAADWRRVAVRRALLIGAAILCLIGLAIGLSRYAH